MSSESIHSPVELDIYKIINDLLGETGKASLHVSVRDDNTRNLGIRLDSGVVRIYREIPFLFLQQSEQDVMRAEVRHMLLTLKPSLLDQAIKLLRIVQAIERIP